MKNNNNSSFSVRADIFFSFKKDSCAPSTIRSDKSKLERIKRFFRHTPIDDIVESDIRRYLQKHRKLSNKTLNGDLSLLRQVFALAVSDRLIPSSPMQGIATLQCVPPECDPYTRAEVAQIASAHSPCLSIKNVVLLSCNIGLRICEALALCHEDYDPIHRRIRVERAFVLSECKYTKNNASDRWVELTDTAVQIIETQISVTEHFRARKLMVLQRDNKTKRPFTGCLLFPNLLNGKPYKDAKDCNQAFKALLSNASVRNRGINQSRHTFASQAIMSGANLHWIARQMGHTSLAMIYKHYARWIEEDSSNFAAQLDAHLNHAEET